MFPRARTITATVCLLAAIVIPVAFHPAKTASAAPAASPAYTSSGEMLPPANYREWIFLTSGIDMSYSPKAAEMPDHSMFDNVFVNPEAYRSFLESGTWPDKTTMVLEAREARGKGSINERGHFQSGGVMGFEIHIKDEARFPGKWAFFSFDSPSSNGTLIPQRAPCYTCHTAHAAVDTTFVQFYPTLLPVATNKGTLSKLYLQEEAAHNATGK
ncbi:MAG TPA: cytochrome P460 family protein [Terracidiphilus sp.]|nr:cytochrome P460 family protein [Terracidiphilus sp.]